MARRQQRSWRAGWGVTLLLLSVPRFAQAQPPAKKYALLIGINRVVGFGFGGVTTLTYAEADARALDEALEKRGWDTKTMVEVGASRSFVLKELYNLRLVAKPQDKVLIYFAGHGVRDSPSGEAGQGDTYWLTYGADLPTLFADGIPLDHILQYVRKIPAREKFLFLDHCYSGDVVHDTVSTGTEAARTSSRSVAGPESVAPDLTGRALVPVEFSGPEQRTEELLAVMGAARGPAYEAEEWGGGMFTKAILDVLEDPGADTSDDGTISLGEFWSKVQGNMVTMAATKGVSQRPFSTDITDKLNWPLFDVLRDAGSEAEGLRSVLTDLNVWAELHTKVESECRDLVSEWESRQQSGLDQDPKHERVIRKLREIRLEVEGGGPNWENLKVSLESLVVGLGLVSLPEAQEED